MQEAPSQEYSEAPSSSAVPTHHGIASRRTERMIIKTKTKGTEEERLAFDTMSE